MNRACAKNGLVFWVYDLELFGAFSGFFLVRCVLVGSDVGDRPSHQDSVLPVGFFDTNGIGILPAQCACQGIAGHELHFYGLLVADEGLDLPNAGQSGVKFVGRHRLGNGECLPVRDGLPARLPESRA